MRHSPKKRIGRTNGLLPFSSIEWLKATITAHNLVACCKRRNQVDEGPFAAASGLQANIVKCPKKNANSLLRRSGQPGPAVFPLSAHELPVQVVSRRAAVSSRSEEGILPAVG
jgi:hypothetical protein